MLTDLAHQPPPAVDRDVPLGHRAPGPHLDDDRRNRLYHLPHEGVVIAAETRLAGGRWRCAVIVSHRADQLGHLMLNRAALDEAPTSIRIDPAADPATFALAWQAVIHRNWCGAHIHALARVLGTELRQPGTTTVHLDTAAIRTLVYAAGLRAPALRILLRRLTDGRLLTADEPDPSGHGAYRLCIPARTSL